MHSQCHGSWYSRAVQAQQWQYAITGLLFLVLPGIVGSAVAKRSSVMLPGLARQCMHNNGKMQSQCHSFWFCQVVQAQKQSQCHSSWFCRAVQAQNWQDAIKIYTLAITNCADAPPLFAAVLHSNRAAVHQHLDQYTDAVADSLRAKALDPSYAKVLPLQHHAMPCLMYYSCCVIEQMRQLPVEDCHIVVLLAVTVCGSFKSCCWW